MLQYFILVLFKKALAVKKRLPPLSTASQKKKKRHNITKLQQNRVNNYNAPSHREASDIPKQLSVAIQSER